MTGYCRDSGDSFVVSSVWSVWKPCTPAWGDVPRPSRRENVERDDVRRRGEDTIMVRIHGVRPLNPPVRRDVPVLLQLPARVVRVPVAVPVIPDGDDGVLVPDARVRR